MLLVSIFSIAIISESRVVRPADGAARILAIETVPSRSHWNFLSAVLGALSKNGHNVTVFTPFPDGDRENYTEIDTSGAYTKRVAMDVTSVKSVFDNQWSRLPYMLAISRQYCDSLYGDRRLNDLLAKGLSADFDAIIVEPVIIDCFSLMSTRSGLPLIFVVPTSTVYFKERQLLGHVSNPATMSPTTADHAVPRTFAQRFSNAVSILCEHAMLAYLELRLGTTNPRAPYDTHAFVPPSLVFVNGYITSDAASPTLPSVVRVGGIHLKPAKGIPEVSRPL